MAASASVASLLAAATAQLHAVAGTEARAEAEWLLAAVLDKDRAWLRAYAEQIPSVEQQHHFGQWLARRVAGEPLAYILGEQPFWTLSLRVTPDVLIPRADTETLVEKALELMDGGARRVLDLGTGSGAIALALASERPQWSMVAVDVSAAALAVAEDNRQRLGLANVRAVRSDWFGQLPPERFDLIVSNPPYVAPGDPHLPALQHEPQAALVAADAGLADLVAIAAGARDFLAAGGWLLLEHGAEQGGAVRDQLIRLGYQAVASYRDLAGHERISAGRLP